MHFVKPETSPQVSPLINTDLAMLLFFFGKLKIKPGAFLEHTKQVLKPSTPSPA